MFWCSKEPSRDGSFEYLQHIFLHPRQPRRDPFRPHCIVVIHSKPTALMQWVRNGSRLGYASVTLTHTDSADGTQGPSTTIRSFRNDTYHIRRVRNSSYLIRNLPQGPFHPRQNFEKYEKSSADENNAMIRNARQEYVSIRIVSVSHSYLNVSKRIIPQSTQSCGLIRFHSGRYLW